METPLDVLSRAASMVETTQREGDSLLSSSVLLDSYDAVGKELPTRALKQERLKERQDLVQALSIDKDHSAKINARKSAATQTQFSSFGDAPPYPGPPPSYFAPRGEGHPGDGYSPVHHTYSAPLLPPPPPHPATLSSPALSPASPGHLVDFPHPHISPDIQNAPLNLSLSSCPSTASSSLTRQQPRPSVITCAASSMSTSTSGSSSPRSSHNGHMVLGSSSSSDDPIDPAIEEHFRRSLGRSYGESISRTSITAATVQANVSITGSVDEHFAKSLGDSKWKAIKSKNDSVDDHFAKALGETTWRLIKAESEIAENSAAGATSSSSATAATSAHTGTSLSAPVAS
ncbi:transcription cofactor vestigial-like protein 4 isoform X2 [Pomacea canaliculata]|uniref:transcription cofactor vestigial-like protein 4 isoform X2 n=1 Tax=Pomacea canaliculata TaxID=400727 RepID=UPI000D72EDA2|nr:transcription cofactor vestigial-like protein 4 isoform X2 [Pomacea canaliculata]